MFMSEKMPKAWEEKLLKRLLYIQKQKNAYWIQTKYLAESMFGYPINDKEMRKFKTRIHRLGERLRNRGQVEMSTRRMKVGNSTGKSLVKYYHAKDQHPSVYDVLKHRREKNE